MLPRQFRKLSIDERVAALHKEYGYASAILPHTTAERMIESAIGYKYIPLGIAPHVLVNNQWYAVPMATEEPSVVAAQIFAAAIIARHGGVQSQGGAAVGVGQVFVAHCDRAQYRKIVRAKADIRAIIKEECATLAARGGGAQEHSLHWQRPASDTRLPRRVLLLEFKVDTVDAMGANRIIHIAEKIARWLEKNIRCRILMAILSNELNHSTSTAQFCIPISALKSLTSNSTQMAEKIVMANAVADVNSRRALTHNKGIMNGICALATATANDTRAIEAAAHGYAASSGKYRTLTRYWMRNAMLHATLTVPLAFATVGGSTAAQEDTVQLFSILNVKCASELRALAAAVGLQQNFAALLALTSDGIVHGHMPLQARRSIQ